MIHLAIEMYSKVQYRNNPMIYCIINKHKNVEFHVLSTILCKNLRQYNALISCYINQVQKWKHHSYVNKVYIIIFIYNQLPSLNLKELMYKNKSRTWLFLNITTALLHLNKLFENIIFQI